MGSILYYYKYFPVIFWTYVLSLVGITILLEKCYMRRWKKFSFFIIYFMAVISYTIVFRIYREDACIIIQPFWSFREIFLNRNFRTLLEVVANILMFIPMGLWLGKVGIKSSKKAGVLGALFSLGIEITQLLLHRGWFEIDDLIMNTLGCLIGYGIYKFFPKFINFFTK